MLIAQCQIRFVEPDGFSLISVILRRADDSADAVVGSVGAGTDPSFRTGGQLFDDSCRKS